MVGTQTRHRKLRVHDDIGVPAIRSDRGHPAGFTERDAEVNGVRIDYSIGGKGSPAIATLAATAPTLVGERLPSIVQFSMRH
jgi:hypothetical protein